SGSSTETSRAAQRPQVSTTPSGVRPPARSRPVPGVTLTAFPPVVPSAGRWTAGVVRHRFGNGLTVLAQHDPDTAAVAVVIQVRAGFFDESDRWQGISHVLEHMFFKGTPTRGVGQIAAETKELGG